MDARGMAIAEGDILALCIRLFSELILGRYHLPLPAASDSPLAHLAHSILDEHARGFAAFHGTRRGPEAEYYVLPLAEAAIMALGHAMAYAAAHDSGTVPAPLLEIYKAGVVRENSTWFSEVAGISFAEQRRCEAEALRTAVPHLQQYAKDLGVQDYVRASIIDDATWKRTVQQLTTHSGAGENTGVLNDSTDSSFEIKSRDVRVKL
jgi:acyl-CoA oxidase